MKLASSTSTSKAKLGSVEWGDRLRKLTRLAPDGVEHDDLESALEEANGEVGKAFYALIGGSEEDGRAHLVGGETLDPEWWDQRFREDEGDRRSEWLLDPTGFGSFLTRHLETSARTLIVGCGNSELGEHLYQAGYRHQVNVDISQVAIEQMHKRHAAMETAMAEASWEVGDCTCMRFAADSFGQIVDKSLLDCMCYVDDVELLSEGCLGKFIRECFRVLEPGGVALFATKHHISVFAREIGGINNAECWCALDWNVSVKIVFVPANEEGSAIGVAVGSRKEIPPGTNYFAFYIYACRKKEAGMVVSEKGQSCREGSDAGSSESLEEESGNCGLSMRKRTRLQ